ncbi:MAG: phosphatidate cytidylyltransferase, partial [Brumimicrobium sp.]
MSNILVRTLSGALFIVIVIGAFLLGELTTAIVLGTFMSLGLLEFYQLFYKNNVGKPFKNTGLITGVLIYLLFIGGQIGLWKLNVLIFLLIAIPFVLLLYSKEKNPLNDLALTYLGLIYVLIPFIIIFQLYNFSDEDTSWKIISGMFLIVWSNDTFAYLSGRFFGKHKLFERISPKKTWEGTIGGFIFAIITGAVFAYFTSQNYVYWLIGAAIISSTGAIGDLVESKIKRIVGVKDSGNIMPGHGGILDRFDAVLFAAPFFYVWSMF